MEQIDWQDWTPKAFKSARRLKRPILLDVSATWCHWCQVMDETTYSDLRVIEEIDTHFVPVRVDTDRRPDINSRYNLGGWPTTAFLDADGELITGGTFISSSEMLSLLKEVKAYFDQVQAGEKPAAFPEAGVYQTEPPPVGRPELLSTEAQKYFGRLAVDHFDEEFGGFGRQLKFPMAGALDLVLALAFKESVYLEMLDKTLKGMAGGRIFDSAEGGFFRYATRRDWSAPHWEKMLADQADLAMIYMEAFSLTQNGSFADIANSTLDYVENNLWDGTGRFFGSQRADETYYKLSLEQRRQVRPPSVDRTTFSGWSARACSAFIKADAYLSRPGASDIALKTLNFLYSAMKGKGGLFHHCEVEESEVSGLGFLTDQTDILTAYIDAYEASANTAFVNEAVYLAKAMSRSLQDPATAAFLDRIGERKDIGALKSPSRPIDLNSRAAVAFIKLARITGENGWLETARDMLGAYASNYREFGLLASEYGLAVGWLLNPTVEIFVTGQKQAPETSMLLQAAKRTFRPHKVIIVDGAYPIKPLPSAPETPTGSAALVCLGKKCLKPTSDSEQLTKLIKEAA